MIYIQAAVLMFFSTVAINALADENKSCHELAGYVAETNELIYLDEIDAALAIPICKSEFETAPNDHNLSFFLARARNADGQYLEAFMIISERMTLAALLPLQQYRIFSIMEM